MKKRILCIVLCVLGVFMLTSCGDDAVSTSSNVTSSNYTVESKVEVSTTEEISSTTETTIETTTYLTTRVNTTASPTTKVSVTVPEANESGENLVWVPINGGTKYHSNPSCSKMKNPKQVSIETAVANGYEPCKKCY